MSSKILRMNDQRFLILDFETRSEAILKTKGKKAGVGAWEYSVHPSTRILCAAWKIGTKEELQSGICETRIWCPWQDDEKIGHPLFAEMLDPSVILVAHNAGFERFITRNVLNRRHLLRMAPKLEQIPIDRWVCTAAMAASHALPRSLDGACETLGLPVQKDKMGKLLIQRHCIPRKPTKNNPAIWNDDPDGLNQLARYCMTDVDAETELFLALPQLIPSEQEVWKLNQRINTRGVFVDRPLVTNALQMIEDETNDLNARAMELTGGIAPTRRAAILEVLQSWGCGLPDMKAKTISDILESGLATGKAAELLKIRQSISKTSTAKYQAFLVRSESDSRLRDLQVFHAASTGREAGSGVQPHNFPRGTIKDVDGAIATILDGDREWLKAIYGDPMGALSSCLRGCIRATPGHELFCADFNAIEARVLFWMAKDNAGLQMFEGADPYKTMASKIYNVPESEITPEQRQVGKMAVLGLGYGMGWRKFQMTCKQFKMEVSEDLAQTAVSIYRNTHHLVTKMWANIERAALAAVRNPKKSISVNRTKWFISGKFLYCELPSTRRLAFFEPSIKIEEAFGRKRETLYHWGIENHQWVNRGTYGGKLVENCDQAIARDLMVTAQLRTEQAGYIPLISVHDELLSERKAGTGDLKEFEGVMAMVPEWADGLPLVVKGWQGERYRK